MQFGSNIQFLLVIIIISSQLFHAFQTFQSLLDIIQLSSSPKKDQKSLGNNVVSSSNSFACLLCFRLSRHLKTLPQHPFFNINSTTHTNIQTYIPTHAQVLGKLHMLFSYSVYIMCFCLLKETKCVI